MRDVSRGALRRTLVHGRGEGLLVRIVLMRRVDAVIAAALAAEALMAAAAVLLDARLDVDVRGVGLGPARCHDLVAVDEAQGCVHTPSEKGGRGELYVNFDDDIASSNS